VSPSKILQVRYLGHMARSERAARAELRDRLRRERRPVREIAAQMQAEFGDRPRRAWRHALDWTQWKLVMEYRTVTGASLDESRLSKWESWPHGGAAPTLEDLARLAATFGHGCTVVDLVDDVDLQQLAPEQQALLAQLVQPATMSPESPAPPRYAGMQPRLEGMMPTREEVTMAADESAQFQRWSAATNVDDLALEQMRDDIADLANAYLVDPPAQVFARAVALRDATFRLIKGRQRPLHTVELYRVAGATCALLAHAAADLSEPHAAMTQARAALHCADMVDDSSLRVYTRWVQSNVAYWGGRYTEAARLVDAALVDAGSGTSALRLHSQQARIAAATGDKRAVTAALLAAERATTRHGEETEPGVFTFPAGKAAYYASEAFRETGALTEAIEWAQNSVSAFESDLQPSTQLVAAAHMDLVRAHVATGDLAAATEHLSPVLDTDPEHRTVPVMSRARTLRDTVTQTGPDATVFRDSLDAFCATPATTPSQVTDDRPPALGH